MNSTGEAEWLAREALSALPAQLTSLPLAAAIFIISIGCLWLRSGADDFSRLPGPAGSWLLGCLKQVNQPQVHRFFQSNTQKYGAGGLWGFRLGHERVVVVCSRETVQAVVSRGNDLPKAFVVYDSVQELFSPVGERSMFNTHDNEEWRVVRKGTAPAFSLDNIRKAFPRLLEGHGTIICVGDVESFHTGPKHGAYAASKYALRGFCKSSYEALRGKGIRVMNIAAGNVGGTAMAQETGKQAGQGAIAPEDVAEAVLLPFRCSANCVPEEIVLKAAQPGNA